MLQRNMKKPEEVLRYKKPEEVCVDGDLLIRSWS